MNIIIDQYRQDFPESWGRVANWEDMEEDDRDIVINLEISKTPYPDFLTTVRYIMKTPGNHTQSAESNGKALDKFLVFFIMQYGRQKFTYDDWDKLSKADQVALIKGELAKFIGQIFTKEDFSIPNFRKYAERVYSFRSVLLDIEEHIANEPWQPLVYYHRYGGRRGGRRTHRKRAHKRTHRKRKH